MLSELAEVLLKKQGSSAQEAELPDLLQSTLHQQTTATSRKKEARGLRAKAAATSANKVLREFMKCDLSLLEVESRYILIMCVKGIHH